MLWGGAACNEVAGKGHNQAPLQTAHPHPTFCVQVLGHARSMRKRPGHTVLSMELSPSGELQELYGNGNTAYSLASSPSRCVLCESSNLPVVALLPAAV